MLRFIDIKAKYPPNHAIASPLHVHARSRVRNAFRISANTLRPSRNLPNARRMLVPEATHDSDYPPCVDATIAAFVRARSAAGLDLKHCAATYRRPSFETLPYGEAAPGEGAAQSKRFRALITEILHAHIDRSQLSAGANKDLSPGGRTYR